MKKQNNKFRCPTPSKGVGHLSSKGFTLIELLVVIAIIGLLATIVLVSLNKAGAKARDAKRKVDISEIQKALEIYRYDNPGNGSYPSEIHCDSSTGSCSHACPCGANDWSQTSGIQTGLVGNKVIGRLPKDPTNNSTYYYYYEPDCNQGACAGKGCCGYSVGCRLEQGGSFILKSGYDN